MTGHIGIVACSAEGASLCFRTICAEGATTLDLNDADSRERCAVMRFIAL